MMGYYDNFDRIFEGFFNDNGIRYKTYKLSPTNQNQSVEEYEINYTKDGSYLFFDAPGFNKTNLNVEMEGGTIHIEGKRTYKLNGEEKTKTIKKEFKIGDGYNPELLEATIEDGLLTVFIPNYKKQEKKRISIL